MSFDRNPALLKLKSAKTKVVRGKYMTVDLVMPDRFQPMVSIAFNLSHTTLKRADAEYLAAAIQRLPLMLDALMLLDSAFNSDTEPDENDLEKMSDMVKDALEGL